MENHGSDDASVQRIRATPQNSTRRCIYRVPNLLRQEHEQEYTPLLVSIGPLHHRKDDNFLPMEDHKLKYLESFLHDSQANANLPTYLGLVKSMEAEIRECYADPIDLSSDEFTNMILIDSVFLIEYLRRICQIVSSKGDDCIFGSQQYLSPKVIRDIRLAENQIPFFVILNLYERAFKPNTNTISNTSVPYLTDIVCRGLGLKRTKIISHVNDSTNEAICLHLLDMSRSHYKPLGMTRDDVMNVASSINKSLAPFTATSLHEAGVKFQVTSSSEIDSSDLLNIGFDAKKGILSIPKLLLMDTTEYMWRNLLAFEQCHYYDKGGAYFSDYIAFLNGLINTCDDVRLLDWAGIIDNYLGSNEDACHFILAVGDNLSISVPHNYTGVTHLLNALCCKRGVLDYRMWQYEICQCNDSPHFHV